MKITESQIRAIMCLVGMAVDFSQGNTPQQISDEAMAGRLQDIANFVWTIDPKHNVEAAILEDFASQFEEIRE